MISIFDSIPANLYHTIYIYVLCGLSLLISFYYLSSEDGNSITSGSNNTNQILAIAFGVFIIIYIGLRPVSGIFVDMLMYDHVYNNIYGSGESFDTRGEWVFYLIGDTCKSLGLSDRLYFLVLAIIYFGGMIATCWRLMKDNLFVALLFCFISFSCFSYGVNGLRNGIACSIIMFAITFLAKGKNKLLFALFLMLTALNIHRSTLLPSVCAIAALFFVKEPKYAFYFWVSSIFISLVAGNFVTELFVGLGFDDRMEQYANLNEEDAGVTPDQLSGFRIDFILYSIIPIIMAWYITIKRNFKDQMYNIIATTYILANAFWVMVIRSEQSNRFAYLSWFLYPIVIAYPLLRMNIWDNQDRKTAVILLLYSGFTFFMNFIYG